MTLTRKPAVFQYYCPESFTLAGLTSSKAAQVGVQRWLWCRGILGLAMLSLVGPSKPCDHRDT